MKLLRETIRRLLLENQSHFDKIIDLITKESIPHINQALELAQTMNYIYKVKYSKSEQYDYRTHHWHFHISHRGFLTTLAQRMQELAIMQSGKHNLWFESPVRESGVYSINLKEYKPRPH